MGMFDSVWVDCPNCGYKEAMEFQSKSGPCTLERFTLADAPAEVLEGLHQDIWGWCRQCGKKYLPRVRVQRVVVLHTLVLVEEGHEEPRRD